MGEEFPDPGVVAVVADDERIRSGLAALLEDAESHECRPLGPDEVSDADWGAIDVLVVDWDLPAIRRQAVVRVARNGEGEVGVLAVFSGVPESDPIADGADHELQLPADEETFLTQVRLTHLQVRYSTEFDEVAAALAEDPDSGETVDRAIDRADEALSELSDHVSYVDLFRRLIDE